MLESVHQLSRIRYFFNEEKSNIDALYFVIGWGIQLFINYSSCKFVNRIPVIGVYHLGVPSQMIVVQNNVTPHIPNVVTTLFLSYSLYLVVLQQMKFSVSSFIFF